VYYANSTSDLDECTYQIGSPYYFNDEEDSEYYINDEEDSDNYFNDEEDSEYYINDEEDSDNYFNDEEDSEYEQIVCNERLGHLGWLYS
jgi:hypothetical protein